MGVNSLPKTVTRQRCGCDLHPGLSAPESSTLTTRLPSHPNTTCNETPFLPFGGCSNMRMLFYYVRMDGAVI